MNNSPSYRNFCDGQSQGIWQDVCVRESVCVPLVGFLFLFFFMVVLLYSMASI